MVNNHSWLYPQKIGFHYYLTKVLVGCTPIKMGFQFLMNGYFHEII